MVCLQFVGFYVMAALAIDIWVEIVRYFGRMDSSAIRIAFKRLDRRISESFHLIELQRMIDDLFPVISILFAALLPSVGVWCINYC